jgi:hypothetical protein
MKRGYKLVEIQNRRGFFGLKYLDGHDFVTNLD